MVIGTLAEVEQRQRLALWAFERELESSAWKWVLAAEQLLADMKIQLKENRGGKTDSRGRPETASNSPSQKRHP